MYLKGVETLYTNRTNTANKRMSSMTIYLILQRSKIILMALYQLAFKHLTQPSEHKKGCL